MNDDCTSFDEPLSNYCDSCFLITDNNEKKNGSESKTTVKINEQNKQNGQRHNDTQKNLLIDLSNDSKSVGNSWVSDET